ncbi:hypothetical protein EMIHUDRAFT_230065, partial [Emiliania huxleyi CCMP1516]|uniref:EGF-like domain-containing protein n=2 Tax=Emiliania huxleyi TaxID=2903 RepID=A0A0D3KBD3_EMIH1
TCGDAGCWAAPQRVASSLSNPRGVAVSAALGKLYVVEQNTLRGASYELFSGDVLQLCTDGRYECGAGQNAGECECATGFGGACCDTPSSSSGVVSLLATAGWWGAFAPPLLAAFALLSFGLRRRRASPLPAGWSLGDASLLEARDARPMPPRVARRRGLFAQLDSQLDAASLAPVNVGGSALSLASLLAPMRQPLLGEGGACSGSHQPPR